MVEAAQLESNVSIDGRLDDSAWQEATVMSAFVQRDPVQGAAPTERTEVRVLYDDEAVYFGAVLASQRRTRHQVPALVQAADEYRLIPDVADQVRGDGHRLGIVAGYGHADAPGLPVCRTHARGADRIECAHDARTG